MIYYDNQTKTIYLFNIFCNIINYTNDQLVKQHYNQLTGCVTENATKLSFASERMQAAERVHNFVLDFCLQTTSTVVEVLRCRSPFDLRRPDSYTKRWRRWDVEQSPFTGVDVCGRRPPCWRKPHRSLRSFSLTGMILSISSNFARIQSSRSQYFTSYNHLLCVFTSTFYWRLASKTSKLIRPPADWSNCRDVTRRGY